ncbi:hypothetical protein [Yinghuangia sp. ASG 101]|nr:hypothetical protein [Yinghuangia sp. ASG 101]
MPLPRRAARSAPVLPEKAMPPLLSVGVAAVIVVAVVPAAVG